MRSRHLLPKLRFAVVGAGAVGGFFGGKLARLGRDVHFLVRSGEERTALQRHGLLVRSRTGDFRVEKVRAYSTTETIGPCDVVLIAVKTTANSALPALLAPLLKPDTLLVTMQNGLGNEEFVAERFGAERVLGCICLVGVEKVAPGVIVHHGEGSLILGEHGGYPQPRTHDLAWEFKRCGVPARVVADLDRERWRKLVWNIPFNGLTVLATAQTWVGSGDSTRVVSVAELLADDALIYLTRRLMDEVIAAAKRLGHAMPSDFAALNIQRTRGAGAYRPSTLVDFLAGRPMEIEAIWGEAYRRAFNAGAEVGRLESLYYLLRSLDRARAVA